MFATVHWHPRRCLASTALMACVAMGFGAVLLAEPGTSPKPPREPRTPRQTVTSPGSESASVAGAHGERSVVPGGAVPVGPAGGTGQDLQPAQPMRELVPGGPAATTIEMPGLDLATPDEPQSLDVPNPPNTTDTDGDGVPDSMDNCPAVPNPTQQNFDGDALGDACDPDDDNDGLLDTEESSQGTNPFMWDTDGDGASDGDEVHFRLSNPLVPDTDGDGLLDGPDNCPTVVNVNQANADHDGLGDVCDGKIGSQSTEGGGVAAVGSGYRMSRVAVEQMMGGGLALGNQNKLDSGYVVTGGN